MVNRFSRNKSAMLAMALATTIAISLAGCKDATAPANSAAQWHTPLTRWQPQQAVQIEDLRLLPRSLAPGNADRVLVSERDGIQLLDAQGAIVAQYPGSFERLDLRLQQDQLQLVTVDRNRQQVMLLSFSNPQQQWQTPQWLMELPWAVEGMCLYQEQEQLFVFLLGTEGQGSQFLVASDGHWLQPARKVRDIAVPPGAEFCQADDRQGQLYISEPGTGLWRYPAGTEAELTRQPVAMRQPFGTLQSGADALALMPGGLLLLDAAAGQLQGLPAQPADGQTLGTWSLAPLSAAEQFSIRVQNNDVEVLVLGEDNQVMQGILQLDEHTRPDTANAPRPSEIQHVKPRVETEAVASHGDAADDPAIWIHAADASLSRILGTNKQQGLQAYDLQGKLLQSLPIGRLNNVDVRYGADFDIAVASNRDHNSLAVFKIDHGQGQLTYAGEVATELHAIYGTCLFQPSPGEWQVFANDKDGTFVQYRLQFEDNQPVAQLLRRFSVGSQPEGCVADDTQQQLYLGEEDTGVWQVDARADQPANKTLLLAVGDVLKADVEGLALHQTGERSSLVISSQGNDSYVVLDTAAPFAVQGVFRVGLNAELGIDGASETDGLDVTAVNLGSPWEQGLLVVQDGRNRLPESNQNFKLVPWSAVAPLLKSP